MYWSAFWDIIGSIPATEILRDEGSTDDAEHFTDDFYERRNPGTSDAEFKMFLLGFCYVLGAAVYLLLTGEIFAITRFQTADARKVRL